MKPGPFPWATNETYVGGPDIGSDTRTESLTVHKEDGYYRARRPAPDIINYQLHRSYITQQFLARLQVLNMRERSTYTGGAWTTLLACCHGIGSSGQECFIHIYRSGVPAIAEAQVTSDVGAYAGTINQVFAVAGACIADSDHESNGTDDHRIVVADDGAGTDLAYYATTIGGGAFAQVTFTAGAPGYNWRAVACDRNNQVWIICSDAQAANTYVRSSSDGINFANVAGFPNATVSTDIQCAQHSNHFAGALGPDDPGNETWLVLSDTYAVRSTDAATWTAAAHGLALGGSNLQNKSAAYSRTSGRWVIPLPGTSWGDIAYSEDNGATWTTNANAIPGASGSADPCITSNGHGVFIVWKQNDNDGNFWVSVDDGDTWSDAILTEDATASSANDGRFYEAAYDETKKAYEFSDFDEYFFGGELENAAPRVNLFRTPRS